MRPEWGARVERLWSTQDASTLEGVAGAERGARIALEAGWGFGLGAKNGLLTPYMGRTLGTGAEQMMRAGAKWTRGRDIEIGLEAQRNTGQNEVRIHGAVRF